MSDADSKIMIASATSPGHTQRVDRAKYMAMRDALIAILPVDPPGITVAEAKAALLPRLPPRHFPRRRKGRMVAQSRPTGPGSEGRD